jgi:hypothetical protein
LGWPSIDPVEIGSAWLKCVSWGNQQSGQYIPMPGSRDLQSKRSGILPSAENLARARASLPATLPDTGSNLESVQRPRVPGWPSIDPVEIGSAWLNCVSWGNQQSGQYIPENLARARASLPATLPDTGSNLESVQRHIVDDIETQGPWVAFHRSC